MALQNRRCKNAADTSLILLEIDRVQKLITEIGGAPVGEEMLVNILWMAMGQSARSYVSIKVGDDAEVSFQVMKEAIMRHTTLVGATSGAAVSRTVAMDIRSISSVTDPAQSPGGGEAPVTD